MSWTIHLTNSRSVGMAGGDTEAEAIDNFKKVNPYYKNTELYAMVIYC